ncbi:MAG: hypothetical protein LH467_00775 [Gemmatimonadaceae bacterium]|nr:hypothetical protein [Gemmatimonadaceae bacterium]
MRQKWTIVATAGGVLTAVAAALAMRDHVRLVEIVSLFASGVATGAGMTSLLAGRARSAVRPAA